MDKETVQQLAFSAKCTGTDAFEVGDVGVAGMPDPRVIYHAAVAIRGKHYTFVWMARSVNRQLLKIKNIR